MYFAARSIFKGFPAAPINVADFVPLRLVMSTGPVHVLALIVPLLAVYTCPFIAKVQPAPEVILFHFYSGFVVDFAYVFVSGLEL